MKSSIHHSQTYNPKVSLIVPIYNGGTTIKQTVDSLLAQTYENIEIVICDNASTDNTPSILSELSNQDSRIHLVRRAEHVSAAENHELALDSIAGDLFMFLGDDDSINPQCVAEMVDKLSSLPDDYIGVIPSVESVNSQGLTIQQHKNDSLVGLLTLERQWRVKNLISVFDECVAWGLFYALIRRDAFLLRVARPYFDSRLWDTGYVCVKKLWLAGKVGYAEKAIYKKYVKTVEDNNGIFTLSNKKITSWKLFIETTKLAKAFYNLPKGYRLTSLELYYLRRFALRYFLACIHTLLRSICISILKFIRLSGKASII